MGVLKQQHHANKQNGNTADTQHFSCQIAVLFSARGGHQGKVDTGIQQHGEASKAQWLWHPAAHLDKGKVANCSQRCTVDASGTVDIHSLAVRHQQVQQAHCLRQHQSLHMPLAAKASTASDAMTDSTWSLQP